MSTAPAPVPHGGARRRLPGTLGAIGLLLLAAILVMLLVDRVFFAHTSTSAGTGSGVASTQARPASRFTAVDLAGFNNVVVRAGARQSVVVHADSNLLTRVTTRVRAGRLVIGTTPGNLAAKSPMYVVVTLPSVEAITLRGAGNITVSDLDSRRLTVRLPGAGMVRATGRATRLDVTISGSGTALLGQLVARDVKAGVSGDGSIMVTATHRLDARVSGTGTILYAGNPAQIARRVTGDGTIAAR
jgi:putative autotransporter adhesin-like protein